MMRRFSSILALLILMSAVSGCTAEPVETNATETVAITPETETAEETEPELAPDLPDVTYDGTDFRLHAWNIEGWHTYEDLSVEDPDKDQLTYSVYKRNIAIEEKYDVKIDVHFELYDTFTPSILQSVKANEDFADIVLDMVLISKYQMMQGPYKNIHNIDYLNLDAPWYDQNSVTQLSVNGYLPYVTTAATLNDKVALFCTFYNLTLAENLGITENIYDIVNEGKWTQDKMLELGNLAVSDVNGNGVADIETDRFGALGNVSAVTAIFAAGGNGYVGKDENGELVPIFYNEQSVNTLVNFLDKIMLREDFFANTSVKAYDHIALFANDRALCFIQGLSLVEKLREMESTFAIIPVPKYNEEQSNYYAAVDVFTSYLSAFPITLDDAGTEKAAILWEALSYESYKSVLPVFYDTVLDNKIVRDEQTKEMLDLLFNNIAYDIGQVYNVVELPDQLMYITNSDIASFYKRFERSFVSGIESISKNCAKFAAREMEE